MTPAEAHMPDHPWRRSYKDMKAAGSPRAAEGARISVASATEIQLGTKRRTAWGTLLMNEAWGHF